MAKPDINVSVSGSLIPAFKEDYIATTAAVTPKAYKSTPFENDFNKAYQVVPPSNDIAKLSLEGKILGILGYTDLCKSDICKRVDAGVQIGVGDWSLSALAQYRHPAGPASFIARGTLGAEWYSGEATSRSEMGAVHLDAKAVFSASASVGAEYLVRGTFPVQVLAGFHYNPQTDMGHGFQLTGGGGLMLTVVGGWNFLSGAKSSSGTSGAGKSETCKDAADALQLGATTLKSAVAQCKDSALPVFNAMVKRLQDFKFAGDSASLKAYHSSLKELIDAIAPTVVDKKLPSSDGLAMLKEVARLYQPLLNEMKKTPDLPYLQEAEHALDYPYMELLRLEVPVDATIKAEADALLMDILQAAIEAPENLPEVLRGLVKIDDDIKGRDGKRSAWLKTHKSELMAAATKIPDKAEKKEITTLLKATFK